jgi:hypothetical protein
LFAVQRTEAVDGVGLPVVVGLGFEHQLPGIVTDRTPALGGP